ncbi:S-adenosylmethionine:tRNA ribosyltransferase-isomerase [Neolewinella aurantiaca]|uniref:S-adenosylmethionine:tRNA ribosyltransferase-isomerase n=1 Tax=Neolewinella aurantiaca TaxID=2602767 RepID=A0A5C7FBQ8_9BACT|nr:S-adenosylmethionine:tRNA ribosyltransferase-isomerase [Neolewinella aurantiaca]TXF84251.1 S-adenosylmethionine:tRNA ribosyltransferase-isomerase [Neolewinella aurantiaca]
MANNARDLSIDVFDYSLPDERIARYPAKERAGAKQLVYRNGEISHGVFSELPDRLPAGTLLIGNRTRVIHARLFFPLAEGKRPIEVFCLDPLLPVDYAQNLGARTQVQWKVLIGGNRRWKRGPLSLELEVSGQKTSLTAERGERMDNTFALTFSWETEGAPLTFGEILAAAGTIPLPPYLGRESEPDDSARYQTVFAKTEGSVAAPTAGLHFTPEVMNNLQKNGVDWEEVTLHVGAGTFKPVDADTLGGHTMHREFFTVSISFIERLRNQLKAGKPVVSVGTTSLRCLESLFYLGAGFAVGELMVVDGPVEVGQWVAEDPQLVGTDPLAAVNGLMELMKTNSLTELSGYTQLLLTPFAELKLADGLITNFHQPRSTLLLLVAAIVGDDWRRIYDYALEHDFRFLSYGDSSLLWK